MVSDEVRRIVAIFAVAVAIAAALTDSSTGGEVFLVAVPPAVLTASTYLPPRPPRADHVRGLAAGLRRGPVVGLAGGCRALGALGLVGLPVPRGVMTGAMHVVSDVISSTIPAIVDPRLGLPGLGSQLVVLAAWAAGALLAVAWAARRTPA